MKITLLISLLSALFFSPLAYSQIALEDVTKDITFLASDDLNGRATFTTDIDNAAQYIASHFKQSGLVPLIGSDSYRQEFSLYSVIPSDSTVTLNGDKVVASNVMVISGSESLTWDAESDVTIRYISAADQFPAVMAQANTSDKNSLIIVDPIHREVFNRYLKHFSRGLNKLAINSGPSAVVVLSELTQIKQFSVAALNQIKKQALANVVAVLPGTSKANEIVLFSAHYDHLGLDTNTDAKGKGDTIYNGADDDASGTTAIINIARYYAKQGNNSRTLMFTAFTAEEIGGFGSQYFSSQVNAADITAMINIEMIGKESKFGAGTFWMTGFERSDLGAIFNRNLGTKLQQVYRDPYPKQNLFYRSDNATLARLGVPAHSFSSTQLDKDQHYHQVSDDIASLNLASMTAVINAIAQASQSLVNGIDTPTRLDTSKVKKNGTIY